ncbi:DNA-processing protein DprA [Modestobacter marinus]|uniref:Putative Rossmann fold nucleotide-binding protein DprA/Smf involved in DNA uptake n=1 Tax=Modestobacter marinus TaxID=477641 RepID=A0A846LV87_9ACTN|nr:DNA-processing protein DprA [Modestobacter marinus]NIH70304.1 putative Rossmann fold nucleotide-binding protein DprA/Smf involved in DNA uptake [Modestobacter marinus]
MFERVITDGAAGFAGSAGAAPINVRPLRRNVLMAALPIGVAVVEAAARSSALSSARAAQAIGRPVLALPGPVTSACSVGCHGLLASGGVRLVTGASDVLSALTARSA